MKRVVVFLTVVVLCAASFPTRLFAQENSTTSKQVELTNFRSTSLVDLANTTPKLTNNELLIKQKSLLTESSRNLKISEFMLQDSNCSEVNCIKIEIYNESENDFYLEGWEVRYLNAAGSIQKPLFEIIEIGAYGYLTFQINKIDGPKNGHLQIIDENEEQVDIVGYGNGKISAKGGLPTASPPDGNSLQRCELPNGLLIDTGKNLTEFKTYSNSTWDKGILCEEDNNDEPNLDMCSFISINEISFSEPEKFIEIINTTTETIDLSDCALRRGNKYINMDGELASGEIGVFDVISSDLTQTNSSVNIYIYDLLQKKNVVTVSYKARTGTSYAWLMVDGKEGWYSTYAMTPGTENIYQQFQTCEAGKHINVTTGNCVKDPEPPVECAEGQFRNPATGRCKKIDSEKKLAECAEGQFRNPITNRCKKINDKTLAECAEGQFRNPLTNRCKKIASGDELNPCAEGWERNPETNRCRKIPIGGEAAYAVGPMTNEIENRTWTLIGAVGAAIIAGLIVWQFRPEIKRFFGQIYAKIKR